MGLRGKLSRLVKIVTTFGAICLVTGCGNPTTSGAAELARSATRGTEAYICNFRLRRPAGHNPHHPRPRIPTPSGRHFGRGSGRGGGAGRGGSDTGRSVSTGSLPSAVAATPNGRLLLVTDQGNDQLAVVDTATDAVISHILVGVEPDAVAVSPNGKTALVANVDDDTVTPIDLTTLRAGHPIPVGSRPDAVAIGGPDGTTALVADLEGNAVTPVDLSTGPPGPRSPSAWSPKPWPSAPTAPPPWWPISAPTP